MMVESSKFFGVETRGYYTSRGYYFEPITGDIAYRVGNLSWDEWCDYSHSGDRTFRYNLDYNYPLVKDSPYFNTIKSNYRYTKMYADRKGDLYLYPDGDFPAKVYTDYHTHPRNSFEDSSDMEIIFQLGVTGVIFGWNGCKHYYYPPW